MIVFIFLVALGSDYNIFLMSRVREEAARHGTSEGMLRALVATGPVITSAGLILAGTFSVLMVLPIWELFEIGFAVAFGVLVDTFIVRSILVPAIVWLVGDRAGGRRGEGRRRRRSSPEPFRSSPSPTGGRDRARLDHGRVVARLQRHDTAGRKAPGALRTLTRYEGFVDPAVPRGRASVRPERADDALYLEAEWMLEFPDGIELYLREPDLVDAATEITVQGMIEGKSMNRLLGTTAWLPASLGNT